MLKKIRNMMTNDKEKTAPELDPTDAQEGAPAAAEDQENETARADAATDAQVEIQELKDKYLRQMAEFDNFRKRSRKEKADFIQYAAKDTLSALLPVLDDFDRAKKYADDPASDEDPFSEGVNAVYHKLYKILEQQGVTVMESNGAPFDADLHEAVTRIPAPTPDLAGKVIDTIEKGYFLRDKILRHAKVVVGQ